MKNDLLSSTTIMASDKRYKKIFLSSKNYHGSISFIKMFFTTVIKSGHFSPLFMK